MHTDNFKHNNTAMGYTSISNPLADSVLNAASPMRLSEALVKTLRIAKVFRENSDRINSIDFAVSGESLISSSDDESIVIYDCTQGMPKKTLNSKKYGVDLIRYTHAANTAIHASTKIDESVFRVVTLCMSPVDDSFLSGSVDHTIRLWDLRSPNCQGLMHLHGRPVANFDPEGLIFAAGINSEMVKLYDLRSFDKGPFSTFRLTQEKDSEWVGLKFSPDGRLIALTTNGSCIKILDAFQGNLINSLTNQMGSKGLTLESSFSPDSQFLFCGSADGRLHCWNVETGNKVSCFTAEHIGAVHCVQFNPKFMMLASACSNMIFWLPRLDDPMPSPQT